MKPVAHERDTEVGGLGESNAFTIAANAKAFRVLIDGLYSDKVQSIIRELCSNAFDAHCAAGKEDVPFEVTLPSRFESTFMVRDFGTSLSHDDVMSLYTTIFSSTKEDTNAEIGKFGLGSKSPFAYTDAFTVRAIDNGVARSYTAFVAGDGVPQIAKIGEAQTDEPQGFEVSFAAQASDVPAFRSALAEVGLGFDLKPIVHSSTPMIWPEYEVVASKPGSWKMLTWTCGAGRGQARARQGCVIYPIDAAAISGLTSNQLSLLRSPLFIEFPIGEVDVTPSRESLSYDPATQENIRNRLVTVEQDIIETYRETFESQETLWQAMATLNGMIGTIPQAMMQVVSKNAKWRGKNINSTMRVGPTALDKTGCDVCVRSNSNVRMRKNLRFMPEDSLRFQPDKATTVYVENVNEKGKPLDKRAAERIRNHVLQEDRSMLWVRANLSTSALRRLLVLLGRPEVVMVSDLPMPESPASTRQRTQVAKLKTYNRRGRWEEAHVDPSVGGYYVHLRNNIPLRADGSQLGDLRFEQLVRLLRDVGVLKEKDEVYGVPGTHKKLPQQHSGWKNILDVAIRTADANLSLEDYKEYLDAEATYDHIRRTRDLDAWVDLLDKLDDLLHDPLPTWTTAQQFHTKVKSLKDIRYSKAHAANYARLKMYVSDGGMAHHQGEVDKAVIAQGTRSRSSYPLLDWAVRGHYLISQIGEKTGKAIVDHIKTVDSERKKDENVSPTDLRKAC
jgi:hypothetical protein